MQQGLPHHLVQRRRGRSHDMQKMGLPEVPGRFTTPLQELEEASLQEPSVSAAKTHMQNIHPPIPLNGPQAFPHPRTHLGPF